MQKYLLGIGLGGCILAGTTLYYYDKWRQERLTRLQNEVSFSLFLLNLIRPIPRMISRPRLMAPSELQREVARSKINWIAHTQLDPAPHSITIDGPLTIDVVFDRINQHAHLFSNLPEIAASIRQIENLKIWNRLFIHNPTSGILEIQATTGSDTICVQV